MKCNTSFHEKSSYYSCLNLGKIQTSGDRTENFNAEPNPNRTELLQYEILEEKIPINAPFI